MNAYDSDGHSLSLYVDFLGKTNVDIVTFRLVNIYIQGVRKILPDWKVQKSFWFKGIL